MKQFIQLTLPTGHVFELPVQPIVEDRAAYYHLKHPDEFKTLDEARADTIGLFDNNHLIWEWLYGDMNIDDMVNRHGRLIAFNPQPFEWEQADRSYHDEPADVMPATSETIMRAPVEMVVAQMAAGGELCNVTLMNDASTGQPQSAMVFIHGGPRVVGMFVNALEHFTSVVAATMEADAAANESSPASQQTH